MSAVSPLKNKVDRVVREIGADNPETPSMASTVNLIASNVTDISEKFQAHAATLEETAKNVNKLLTVQEAHGVLLADHGTRITRLESVDCPLHQPEAVRKPAPPARRTRR